MIILENEKLKLTFSQDAYSGQRFDNTGIITQIELKSEDGENTTFCTKERLEPGEGSGGIGLANEFDIEDPDSYDKAEEGSAFLKIGVGWLRKPRGRDYFFMDSYEVIDAGKLDVSVSESRDAIRIRWDIGFHNGYGCLYEMTIELVGEAVIVSYSLTNTGSTSFQTKEYAHNFVNVGNAQVEEGNYDLSLTDSGRGNLMRGRFIDYSLQESNITVDPGDYPGCRGWRLMRKEDGLSISETEDFSPVKIGIWSRHHVVSCELFNEVRLRPGEAAEWSRTYTIAGER